MRKKLSWYSVHPNIYNDYLFRELVKKTDIDLKVYFNEGVLDSHPWKTKMGEGFFNEVIKHKSKVDWSHVKAAFKAKGDEYFLIASWSKPTFIALVIVLGLRGKDFFFWTDTPNLDKKRGALKTFLRNLWLKFLAKRVKYFLVTGDVGVKAALQMGFPKHKVIKFPFATNIDQFKPIEKNKDLAQQPVLFISSGRLDNGHKGHDLAIKALAQLRDEGLDNFVYHIAGVGPDQEKLENLLRETQMEDKVKLLGWMEPEEVLNFYHSGDLLLHTSHFDPFPNAVMEAMACGVPVIGSDKAGSVSDRVENGKNGYVHTSGSVEEIKECIAKVLREPRQIEELGKNARKTAELWSVDYNVKIIQKITA